MLHLKFYIFWCWCKVGAKLVQSWSEKIPHTIYNMWNNSITLWNKFITFWNIYALLFAYLPLGFPLGVVNALLRLHLRLSLL